MANVYVLLVYQPGSRSHVRWWRTSPRPWTGIRLGRTITKGRRRYRIIALRRTTSAYPRSVRHFLHVYTRLDGLRGALPSNVVTLPMARRSAIADFLRYHVLVRVFDGDPDRWLDHLRQQGDFRNDDIRFVRWIRGRLRREPKLMEDIRRMVAQTPLWEA